MRYQPYRDEPFQRNCEDRYEPIKELASKFNRQFSVLDIGANFGYFGQRLVRDFDCIYVGIDNKVIDPHPRIWHIPGHFTGRDYLHLSRSEHFDIVLGLAVLHHFPDYVDAYNAMRILGQWTFFEIPGPDDNKATGSSKHSNIAKLFEEYEPIAHFPSHVSDTERPWYLLENEPFLDTQSLDARNRGAPKYAKYKITSDFDKCRIKIDRRGGYSEDRWGDQGMVEERDYIPGMNAHNFKLLGGEVEIPDNPSHPDHRLWNYVVGDGIKPIDDVHVKAGSFQRWASER